MKNGMVISSRVVDTSGRGIEGGEVIQFQGSNTFQDWMLEPARTDARGQFALRVEKAGEITIYVQAKGFAAEQRSVKAAPGLPPVEFRLKKGEIISGHVVDEGGNPIPNATIRTGNALPGRIQPFSWMGKTDESGRFLWDSAPANPLSYGISASGYDSPPAQVLEPGREHEIRLVKGSEVILTGRVTDAKTKMPLDIFRVSILAFGGNALRSVNGKDGEFSLSLPARSTPSVVGGRTLATPSYDILIDAEGYAPDLSQTLELKPGNRHIEVALNRSNGLSGVVLLPGGRPAPGANVFLCGSANTPRDLPSGVISVGSGPMMMDNKAIRCTGSSGGSPFAAAAEADASGRFSLKAVPQAHSFYAVHEKGIAVLSAENLTASGQITLQPWGQVAGIVMVGRKPAANQAVNLSTLGSMTQRPPALRVMLTTTTDVEGRFEFASVPPGEYRITHTGHSANAVVRSGESVSLKIGGTGRPLTGRIVVPGSDPDAPPKIQSANLSLKLPDDNIPSPTDAAAYRQWMDSEAYLERARAQHSYTIRPETDGTFRLEDIPAGTYTLTVMMARSEMPQPGIPLARPNMLTKEIVVPEMPGGRSDDPLNLGAINFQVPAKK